MSDKFVRLHEYPFSSEQKMMTVQVVPKYSEDKTEIFFTKGAIQKVLQQCTKYKSGGSIIPLNVKKEQDFLSEAYEIGRKGLRGVYSAQSTCFNIHFLCRDFTKLIFNLQSLRLPEVIQCKI